MKKDIFLLSLIVVVIFSGCLESSGGELGYKNDIITIEDYYVSNLKPHPKETVAIEFSIKNNGEESVPRVEIGVPIYPGFEIEELYCEGGRAIDDETCVFDDNEDSNYGKIESLDWREVRIKLKTMNMSLLDPLDYITQIYVGYDYSGLREMHIPIIDGTTRKRPMSAYSQSSATYGPIRLDYELIPRGETVVDGQSVNEYWGVNMTPFKVEMKFTHVGSMSIGTINQPQIWAGNIRVNVKNTLTTPSQCDFIIEDILSESSGHSGYILLSQDDLNVPDELMCNFQSVPFDDPETTATIETQFFYKYRYTVSEEFEIQPER